MDIDEASTSSDRQSLESFRNPPEPDCLLFKEELKQGVQSRGFSPKPRYLRRKALMHSKECIFSAHKRRQNLRSSIDMSLITLDFTNFPSVIQSKPTFHLTEVHPSNFEKRDITTIQEEVFHYKKPALLSRSMKSKHKEHKDKVASLKLIIGRLKETYLTEPEVLKNNVSDETLQLFKKLQI